MDIITLRPPDARYIDLEERAYKSPYYTIRYQEEDTRKWCSLDFHHFSAQVGHGELPSFRYERSLFGLEPGSYIVSRIMYITSNQQWFELGGDHIDKDLQSHLLLRASLAEHLIEAIRQKIEGLQPKALVVPHDAYIEEKCFKLGTNDFMLEASFEITYVYDEEEIEINPFKEYLQQRDNPFLESISSLEIQSIWHPHALVMQHLLI